MAGLLAWTAFAGAWLLFAGPVYQAALELDEQEIERDEIAQLADRVQRPAPISPWWWLVPPIGYLLQMRRNHDYRQAAFAAMSPTLKRQFVTFTDKAAGWLMVAAGALLLAVAETANLGIEQEWAPLLTVVVIVAAAVLAASYTAWRMRRRHFLLGERPEHDRPSRRKG